MRRSITFLVLSVGPAANYNRDGTELCLRLATPIVQVFLLWFPPSPLQLVGLWDRFSSSQLHFHNAFHTLVHIEEFTSIMGRKGVLGFEVSCSSLMYLLGEQNSPISEAALWNLPELHGSIALYRGLGSAPYHALNVMGHIITRYSKNI